MHKVVTETKGNRIPLYMAAIIVLAAILRLWGISFGLPHIQHLDEGAIIHTAFYMAAERGRPDIYLFGTVVPGIMAFVSGFLYLGGKLAGIYQIQEDFLIAYIKDPSLVVLWGRLIVATLGVLSVYLVYFIGNTFYGKKVGYLAALFLAVSTLHVKESHYLKQDIVAGLVALVFTYVIYKAAISGRKRDYILSGLLYGLAVATKYYLVWLIVSFGIIYSRPRRARVNNPSFYGRKGGRGSSPGDPKAVYWFGIVKVKKQGLMRELIWRKAIWILFSALLTFFILHPYVVLDPKFFLLELQKWSRPQLTPVEAKHTAIWYFLFDYLPQGLGYAIWAAGGMGILYMVLVRRKREDFLLASLPLIFLATVDIWAKNHVPRFAVPILPFWILAAALLVEQVLRKSELMRISTSKKVLGLALLVGGLVYQPMLWSLKFDKMISSQHTGLLASRWMERNLNAGTKVAVEGTLKPYYSSSSGPYLVPDENSLKQELNKVEGKVQVGRELRAMLVAYEGEKGFRIIPTPKLAYIYNYETGDLVQIDGVEYYLDRQVEFLVFNSWAGSMSAGFKKSLEENYFLVAEFKPSCDFKTDPHVVGLDPSGMDCVEILNNRQIFGPTIAIYRKL